eukprot:CAMPEP_0172374650 /NCGR_PEP_ID=MMETSP1060-20121228/56629_1 /TAXON_ID=37318 /ORGANISM="Pseudo-nitzschia pungens, Strain cf. cingulata" /LENGTH=185 /DNA_ID=CAMNT_0013101403 /DNA_START=65 /DNA_END=619 /DNA_ORIENTATION=+
MVPTVDQPLEVVFDRHGGSVHRDEGFLEVRCLPAAGDSGSQQESRSNDLDHLEHPAAVPYFFFDVVVGGSDGVDQVFVEGVVPEPDVPVADLVDGVPEHGSGVGDVFLEGPVRLIDHGLGGPLSFLRDGPQQPDRSLVLSAPELERLDALVCEELVHVDLRSDDPDASQQGKGGRKELPGTRRAA